AIGAAVLLLEVGPAVAGDDQVLLEMKARLDKLEKQNEELRQKLESKPIQISATAPAAPADVDKEKINKQIDAYLKQKDDKKKAAQEEAEGFKVGSSLGISTRWNPDQGLMFETAKKDFVAHLGFFFQWDTVAFTQTPTSRLASQIGDLQDGTYFRRIRPL